MVDIITVVDLSVFIWYNALEVKVSDRWKPLLCNVFRHSAATAAGAGSVYFLRPVHGAYF